MVLGLGESVIKQIPNEPAVVGMLQTNLKETGFYFFPGMDESRGMTKEQKAAAEKKWMEQYQAGPWGILIYHPQGEQAVSPRKLGGQFGAEVVAGLVVAWLLAAATGLKSYGGRLLFVAVLGLIPFLAVNFPYWNWYGFPTNFTMSELADKLITFVVAGLVLAAVVKPRAAVTVPS